MWHLWNRLLLPTVIFGMGGCLFYVAAFHFLIGDRRKILLIRYSLAIFALACIGLFYLLHKEIKTAYTFYIPFDDIGHKLDFRNLMAVILAGLLTYIFARLYYQKVIAKDK